MYVYDMPARFNKDIVDLPTIWHPEQYDIDQVRSCIHDTLTCGACRT